MSEQALNNQMTAKKPPQPPELTFFDYFEYVMRNQKNYRKAFVDLVHSLFKYDVGVHSYVFSDIGFSIINKEQDFILTIENVGCDLKVLIQHGEEAHANYFKSEETFSLWRLIRDLKNL